MNPLATIGSTERMAQSAGVPSTTPLDLDGAMLLRLAAIPYPYTPTDGETLTQALTNEQAEWDFAVVMYLTGWIYSNPGKQPTGASSGKQNVLQGIANKVGESFTYTLKGEATATYTPGPYFPGQ